MKVLGLRVAMRFAVGSGLESTQDARPVGSEPEPGQDARLAPGAGEASRPDLEVWMLGERPWPAGLGAGGPWRVSYTSPNSDENGIPLIAVSQQDDAFHRVRYFDGSEFLLDRAGTRVWARWPAGVPAGEMEMCLLGPILGFVLHLRGTPCLHASAVEVDGRGVAFLGHSGAGKSTTAAALIRAGYAGVTDDVLALDEGEDGAFRARPGHNMVRLWPDAVRALYGREDVLPRGADEKHQLELSGGSPAGGPLEAGDGKLPPSRGCDERRPVPLGAIYVLEERRDDLEAPAVITPLRGHAALMALVARTYMNYVLDAGLKTRALDLFARLAASVPVRQVTARHDADGLGELAGEILRDLRK